jgi:hypothetical protein
MREARDRSGRIKGKKPKELSLQRYLRCNNALHLPGNAFIAFGLPADKKPAALTPRPGLLVASKAQKRKLRFAKPP